MTNLLNNICIRVFKVCNWKSSFGVCFLIIVFGCSSPKTKHLYNVLDYGAIGDSQTLNTSNIQAAIDACSNNGGGTVYFPSGTYLSGTIQLKDNIHLYLDAGTTILASKEHKDFPRQKQPRYRSQKDSGGWFSLIYGVGLTNISITGQGTIDGNGVEQKPRLGLLGNDRDGRPRNLLFISCKKIKIEGITMRNSGIWNQHYLNCEDVFVNNINVYNHSNRNNDAIDIDGCRRVTISNSIFDSDDDGITLKSTGTAPTEDVAITNCVISSYCNAIKAGTESTGGFKNIAISNCIIKPSRSKTPPIFDGVPKRGITGISLEIVDGGTMESIAINNITIEGTQCPLYIRLGNRGRKHSNEAPEPQMGVMKNITISNLIAYETGNFSNSITSIPGSYIENVSLHNIQIFNKGGLVEKDFIIDYAQVKEEEKSYPQPTVWGNLPSSLFFVRHVKNLVVSNLTFGSENPDPRIPFVGIDVHNVSIGNFFYTGGSTSETFALLRKQSAYSIDRPMNWEGKYWLDIK